jgi:hypothetical protein
LGTGPPTLRSNTGAGMIGTESTSVGCTVNLKLSTINTRGDKRNCAYFFVGLARNQIKTDSELKVTD